MSSSEEDPLSEAKDRPEDDEYIPGQGTEIAEIPVTISGKEIRLSEVRLDTGEGGSRDRSLPEMEEGAAGTLRVKASALQDPEERRRYTDEHLEIIVPYGNLIWLKIRTAFPPGIYEDRPDYAKAYLREAPLPSPRRAWKLIPVEPQGHVWLRHRGAKPARIQEVECALPKFLREGSKQSVESNEIPEVVNSLHQAYVRLSRIFQTYRKTHSDSVYKKGFVWNPTTENWIGLEDFRTRPVKGSVWETEEGSRDWLRPWWYSPVKDDFATLDAGLLGNTDTQVWWAHSQALEKPPEKDEPRTQKEAAEALSDEGYQPSKPPEDSYAVTPVEKRNWDRYVPGEH